MFCYHETSTVTSVGVYNLLSEVLNKAFERAIESQIVNANGSMVSSTDDPFKLSTTNSSVLKKKSCTC